MSSMTLRAPLLVAHDFFNDEVEVFCRKSEVRNVHGIGMSEKCQKITKSPKSIGETMNPMYALRFTCGSEAHCTRLINALSDAGYSVVLEA